MRQRRHRSAPTLPAGAANRARITRRGRACRDQRRDFAVARRDRRRGRPAQSPDYRDRTSPDGMMTIVFTDIEGSTTLIEALGEEPLARPDARSTTESCASAFRPRRRRGQVPGRRVHGGVRQRERALALRGRSPGGPAGHTSEPSDGPSAGAHRAPHRQDLRDRARTSSAWRWCSPLGSPARPAAARSSCPRRLRDYTEGLRHWRYGAPADLTLKGIAKAQRVYALEWRRTGGAPA